ncbi:response regulator transcription factor [Runella zeae]|jgi:DNA-binding NarL/FixJ family response regulator|uniref:response regulator transcription factor n=1 Tax=Runella zeae TaxID=94255 RepID=UPI00056679B8|nr:response regulator transcription factor [Runella zeae]
MKNNEMRIRKLDSSVLVAKEEPFSCEVLSKLLEREGFDVVGRANELDDLIQKIHTKKPKCVIVEANLIGKETNHLLKELASTTNPPKLVLYFNASNSKELSKALDANFHGYLYSEDRLDELYKCLLYIQTQSKYYSDGFKDLMKKLGLKEIDSDTQQRLKSLTKREKQILYLVTEGLTGYEIADSLCISYRTLANHKQNLIQKLGIDSNRHLLKFGLQIKSYLDSI